MFQFSLMNKDISEDYLDFHRKYKNFNSSFADFQRKSRINNNYYEFEAYRDLKICLSLYAEVYDLLGYHHLEISPKKLSKIIKKFSSDEKRDLIYFFVKKLTDHGNIEKEEQFSNLLVEQEIICCWTNLKKRKSIISNACLLIFKLSSYNIYSLIFSLLLLSSLFSLVFLPAPWSWMEILSVKKINISNNYCLNHIANTLLYFFDIGDHMKVSPLTFFGVLILIILKVLIVMVIGNFLFKKIIRKIKFS